MLDNNEASGSEHLFYNNTSPYGSPGMRLVEAFKSVDKATVAKGGEECCQRFRVKRRQSQEHGKSQVRTRAEPVTCSRNFKKKQTPGLAGGSLARCIPPNHVRYANRR